MSHDPTVLSDADARAHYRAVVARVEALCRKNNDVARGKTVGDWPGPLNAAGVRLLRRAHQGAVRQLRALGERV